MTQMQQPDEAPDTVALARVVVRDADAGHVLYEAMDTLDGVEGAAGRAVVEHEMAVPAGSVVVLGTGGRKGAVADAIAGILAVRADDVTCRLLALPAIAAYDLERDTARAIVRAVERAGGRAVAV